MESDQFLETYNGLNTLERQTGRQMTSAMLEVTGRSKSVDQVKTPQKEKELFDRRGSQQSSAYVPRNQKFNHLLDTAYQVPAQYSAQYLIFEILIYCIKFYLIVVQIIS